MSRFALLSLALGFLALASGCCCGGGACGRGYTSYNYNPAYPTAYAPSYSTAYNSGCSNCATGVAPF